MQQLLLTGDTGFLGEYVRKELLISHVCFAIRRRSENIEGVVNCDLALNVPKIDFRIEGVVHMAGLAHFVPRSEIEKVSFYEQNLAITRNLLEGLEQQKSHLKSFVYISSVAIYGQDIGNFISEESIPKAEDPYGKSKLKSEEMIQHWCRVDSIPCLILRLPLVVGLTPPGNLAAMIRGIQNGYYFRIGKGEARRSMVLADDVASVIGLYLGKSGVYNLTDGIHPDFHEVEVAIKRGLGINRRTVTIPLSLARILGNLGTMIKSINKNITLPIDNYRLKKLTSSLTFSSEKAKRELNWAPNSVIKFLESGSFN